MIKDNRRSQPIKFFKYFEQMKLLAEELASVALTEKEKHYIVNDRLAPEDRVSYKTVEKWRSRKDPKRLETIQGVPDDVKMEYRDFIETTRAKQKMKLIAETFKKENNAAYKQHWVLERKFEDLRSTPNVALHNNPTIRIEAADPEARKMIDKMVNGETIEVDHEEID